MTQRRSEDICAACGCEETKTIPFTDGKNVKWILTCSNCESVTDSRVLEVYYEPYHKTELQYPVSLIRDMLSALF
jgi:hypothetical protein